MKNWTTASEINVFRLLGGRCNVFIIKYQNAVLLIDTSTQRNQNKLFKRLRQAGIQKIDYLLLTHSHFDHAANTKAIKENFGAKVIIQQLEAVNIEQGINQMPDGTNWFTSLIMNWIAKPLAGLFMYNGCKVDLTFNGEIFIPGTDNKIKMLHTPGHTAGSSSVIIDDEIALVGDTLFGVFPYTVLPPYGNNIEELHASWIKLYHSGWQLFIPSHGRPISRSMLKKHLT